MVCREEGAEPRRRRRRYRPVSRAALLPVPSQRSPARSRSARRAPSLPRRWLRALSSCQSVSPGRGPIALELLPRRLGLRCAAARSAARRSLARSFACSLAPSAPAARLRLRRPLLLRHRCRRRRRAAGLLGAQPNVAARAGARRASTPRDGRLPRPIGARGRARRPGGTPVSAAAAVPLRRLREPLPAPKLAGGAGGEPGRWDGAGALWAPAPAWGPRPALQQRGPPGQGRCGSVRGRGRGPQAERPSPPARPFPLSASPPPAACARPALISPSPRLRPRPLPRLRPGPAPRPGPPCAQLGFLAPARAPR
jgi:hypothetical protein